MFSTNCNFSIVLWHEIQMNQNVAKTFAIPVYEHILQQIANMQRCQPVFYKYARNVQSCQPGFYKYATNIARGTTDPEIDSVTWIKFSNNMAPLALIANLATRWRYLTFSHSITFSHQITFIHWITFSHRITFW